MSISSSKAPGSRAFRPWSSRAITRLLVLVYILLIIYPVFFVILTSVKSTNELYTNVWGWPKVFHWSNFTNAWTTGGIGSAFVNSCIVVFTSLALILICGGLAGYALARLNIPKAGLITLVLVASTMLPAETNLLPEYLMASKLQLTGTDLGLILSYIGWGLPITIYIFRGFILTIPNELIEAARIDGAGELRIFLSVVAPLLLPAIATTAIFNFVSLWGELLWAVVLLSNQADVRTLPLAIVSFQGQFSTDWGELSATICIVLVPLIIFFLFTQRYFLKGLTEASLK